MKIYKIKVNGKTYRVELENIEEVSSDPVKETVETKKSETKTAIARNQKRYAHDIPPMTKASAITGIPATTKKIP